MKYIILCGGRYSIWETPRQLCRINNEYVVERTIRLLRECGVTDIAISTHDERFNQFGVEIINAENSFICCQSGYWVDAFPLIDEPVCYIFGDVVFTLEALKEIVNTDTDDIQFFASCPPYVPEYIKIWEEPFAFKVRNTKHFAEAVQKTKQLQDERKFNRLPPISWELWQVIKNTPLNEVRHNYHVVNDISCDIDRPEDLPKLQALFNGR